MIDLQDWDDLVSSTYGKPYSYQQQNGCQSGIFSLDVPNEEIEDDYYDDSIPEVVNGDVMGVKFDTWLKRDPKQPLKDMESPSSNVTDLNLRLFWYRNFYPDIHTIANDLHKRGLLDEGSYVINIDW